MSEKLVFWFKMARNFLIGIVVFYSLCFNVGAAFQCLEICECVRISAYESRADCPDGLPKGKFNIPTLLAGMSVNMGGKECLVENFNRFLDKSIVRVLEAEECRCKFEVF